MSVFNQRPRPPRPTSPGMDRGAQMAARRAGGDSLPGAPLASQPRLQMPGPKTKGRIKDARRLMPPAAASDRQAGQTMRDSLRPIASFLDTPGRVVRGAVEGGIQGVNPDFQMPSLNDAQMPGIDFMNFITGSGLQDESEQIPLPRSFDPGTDALLRAIMRQMQGGQ